jgi:hypothetical protein
MVPETVASPLPIVRPEQGATLHRIGNHRSMSPRSSGIAHAWLVAGLILLAAWLLVGIGTALATSGHLADASSYGAAVDRWLSGASPYSAEQLSGPHTLGNAVGGVGFVYPPAALVLFLPLGLGFEVTLLWVLLIHATFVAVAFLIARRELAGMPLAAPLVALVAALALPGLNEGIRFGNASALIAALVGAMWLVPHYAASLAVLAGAIKVFPVIGAGWAVRWGDAIRPAVVLGVTLLLISQLVGVERWFEWVTAMTTAVPSCPEWALVSLECATGSSLPGWILAAVLFAGSVSAPSRTIGFFLMSVAMIAPAPDLYQHYTLIPFVGVIPVACEAARWAAAQVSSRSPSRLATAAP